MKKKFLLFCLLANISLLLTGCGTSVIKYNLSDLELAQTNQRRQKLSLAVVCFQDIRPYHEKYSKYKTMSTSSQTRDKNYENSDVAGGVTQALVEHFTQIKLFKKTEIVNILAESSLPEIEAKLKYKNYDLLLTGTISHFYGIGYSTEFDNTMVGLSYIPGVNLAVIAASPLMLAQKNKHEGHVEIIDFKLTDIDTSKILLSGSFSKKINMEYLDIYPDKAANETLKEVVKKIVKKIETVDFQEST
jgi:curli biogenesis system outer membrane secretion channel CsgG